LQAFLSNSPLYEEGTMITTMAHYEDKIKVSSRIVGRNGRNAREILNSVIEKIGGEVGGHESAAGCIIKQEKRKRRHKGIKNRTKGTSKVPRLCVFRSNQHIYAQLIDDEKGKDILSLNDLKINKNKNI